MSQKVAALENCDAEVSKVATELSIRIQNERKELEGWLEYKSSGNPNGKLGGWGWWNYHMKIGGAEQIALKMQNVQMDTNLDGSIDQKEYADGEKLILQSVNSALSQMTTQGVIGALLVTVLYPLAITNLVPSDKSLEYFGDVTIYGLSLTYRFIITLALGLSLFTVYFATRMYLQLSVWMHNSDMKSWYLSEISLVPLIGLCQATIIVSVICIPLAVAVQIGQYSGLLSLLVCFLVLSVASFLDNYINIKLVAKMHEFCHSFIKKKSE